MAEAEPAAMAPMAERAGEPPLTDWTLRPFTSTAHSPLWVGLGLVVAVTGASQGLRLVIDAPPAGAAWYADPYLWLDLLNAVLLAYIPIALVYLRRGRLRDLGALRPALACDERGFAELVEEVLCVPPRRLAAGGLAGTLIFGCMPLVDPGFWGGGPRPALDAPLLWVLVLRSALTGWVSGHAVVSEAQVTAALARTGARRLRVDLLDLEPLSAFARASQRGALAWVGVSSLVSLFWLGPAAGTSNAVIVAGILVLVSVSFCVSIYGAHRSIVAAKRKAVAALERQIRPRAHALLSGAPVGEPRLADLVAYRGFVAAVREWPLGAPALLRGALIAGLAVGSWLGGALAERLLERALG